MLALIHYGHNAKINGVEEPENFIEPEEKNKKLSLPKGVSRLPGGKYRASISNKHLGVFRTIDQAYIVYYNTKELRNLKKT